MDSFSLSERYRLELRWNYVKYEVDNICNLNGAYFKGPALSDAVRLNDEDHILLDFFAQYFVVVSSVYVAKLYWNGVIYNNDGAISLVNASISHDTELNKVPKFNNTDYLIIDTSNHEVVTHQFYPVYKTFVVNENSYLYNFRG